MGQAMTIQSAGSLEKKSRLPVIIACSLAVLILAGVVLGFVWTVNLKFKPAYSLYMDFRATEISMVQLLDKYDKFRNEAPADPRTWKELQHIRNGHLNLAIKELQHKYVLKIRAYNRATSKIGDFYFVVGCKINRVEIPKEIILSVG